MQQHIINSNRSLLDALKAITNIQNSPLVLFVINDDGKMMGTLTDGDSRRALVSGVSVDDCVEKVMHRNFNYLRKGVNDDAAHIKEQRLLKMTLVPILDDNDLKFPTQINR